MSRLKTKRRNEGREAFLFLLPNFIGFLVFTLIPIIAVIVISLLEWDFINTPTFVGLSNYSLLFQDPQFGKIMGNTLLFTVYTVPLNMILGLFLAILLNQKLKGKAIFRTFVFAPYIACTTAVAILWKWMYNDQFGLIPYAFKALGLASPRFLSDPNVVMTSIAIMTIWKSVGYNVVMFLAGLQGISPSYYEAADIDGANSWQKIFKITLPMLSPTTFFLLVMAVVSSFQVFEQTYILTSGGPSYASTTLVYYLYQYGFVWHKFGISSALSLILFIFVFAVTVVQMAFEKRWVNYD